PPQQGEDSHAPLLQKLPLDSPLCRLLRRLPNRTCRLGQRRCSHPSGDAHQRLRVDGSTPRPRKHTTATRRRVLLAVITGELPLASVPETRASRLRGTRTRGCPG